MTSEGFSEWLGKYQPINDVKWRTCDVVRDFGHDISRFETPEKQHSKAWNEKLGKLIGGFSEFQLFTLW